VMIDININEDYFQGDIEQQDLLASPKPGGNPPEMLIGAREFSTWDKIHPKPQPGDQGAAPTPDRDRGDRTRPGDGKKPGKGIRPGRSQPGDGRRPGVVKPGSGRGTIIRKPSPRNPRFKPAPRSGDRTYRKGLKTRPGSKYAGRRTIRAPKRSVRRAPRKAIRGSYRRSPSRSRSSRR
jgi:hypothetical protein